VLSGVHLIPFQKTEPFDATIVFFLTDDVGRANYGFYSFEVPAISAEDRDAVPMPALDAEMLNVGQGDEIVIRGARAFVLQV
jgi:hypothetical protein